MNNNMKKAIRLVVLILFFSTSFVGNVYGEETEKKSKVAVILNIKAEDTMSGINEMMLSNHSDFKDGVWEEYQETKEWTLLNNYGKNIVYIKIKDNQNNISETFEMIVDLSNEEILSEIKVKVLSNDENDMTLKISMPNNKNLKEMRFSGDNRTYTEWENYEIEKVYRFLDAVKGNNTLYVKVRDINNVEYLRKVIVNKPGIYDNGIILSNEIDAISGKPFGKNIFTTVKTINNPMTEIDETVDFVSNNVLKESPIYILGGRFAIPKSIENQLKEKGFKKVVRIFGEYKNDTSKLIAEQFKPSKEREVIILPRDKKSKFTQEIVKIAEEKQYPIMYSKKNILLQNTKDIIVKLNSKTVYIVGSKDEISEEVINEISKIRDVKVIRIDSIEELKDIK